MWELFVEMVQWVSVTLGLQDTYMTALERCNELKVFVGSTYIADILAVIFSSCSVNF
jgi:hypothetical protein